MSEKPAADRDCRRDRPRSTAPHEPQRRVDRASRPGSSARTTGITTSGIATKTPTNSAASPTATRIRQLHGRDAIEPGRHERGELRSRSGIEDRDRGARDGEHDGRDRDRSEQADDPRQLVAGRQHDQDHRRVDVHALAVHGGPDAVAEDRVADRDQDEQRDHGPAPERGVRDEQDDPGGDEAAEVRDVAAEEREHRQRQRQRHAEHHHEHVVGHRDHRREDRGAAQVAADAPEGVVAGRR